MTLKHAPTPVDWPRLPLFVVFVDACLTGIRDGIPYRVLRWHFGCPVVVADDGCENQPSDPFEWEPWVP